MSWYKVDTSDMPRLAAATPMIKFFTDGLSQLFTRVPENWIALVSSMIVAASISESKRDIRGIVFAGLVLFCASNGFNNAGYELKETILESVVPPAEAATDTEPRTSYQIYLDGVPFCMADERPNQVKTQDQDGKVVLEETCFACRETAEIECHESIRVDYRSIQVDVRGQEQIWKKKWSW